MPAQSTVANFFRSYHFPLRGESAKTHKRSANDSIWALILSFQKSFPSYSFESILYDLTLENIIMYQKATPLYDDKKDGWDESLDANDPHNFGGSDEEEFVR